jgi:hypothetical protein
MLTPQVMRGSITESDWLTPATKEKALVKLDKFRVKIGCDLSPAQPWHCCAQWLRVSCVFVEVLHPPSSVVLDVRASNIECPYRYPDEWKDYSAFDVREGDSLYAVAKKAHAWSLQVCMDARPRVHTDAYLLLFVRALSLNRHAVLFVA